MEICVLNPFFFPYQGGTERVLLSVYARLAKRHNITVISATLEGKAKAKATEDYVDGIRVIRVKTRYIKAPKLPLPFMKMYGVNDQIASTDADIYHINNRFLYYGSTINTIRSMGKKIVLTLHNSKPQNIDLPTDVIGTMYDVAWGRKIMEKADEITGVSNNTIEVTVPKKLQGKARVIYNGVDFNIFKFRGKRDPKVVAIRKELDLPEKVILNNARLVPQKGYLYLIKAFAELSRRYGDDIGLMAIGRGPLEKKIRRMAKQLKIRNFKLLSGIPEIDLPYYYNASDVFVFPSLYEPAGAALLEALSSGLPSVATRIGGIPEYMRDSGYYIDDRDPAGIVEAVEHIISEPRKAKALARAGRKLMIKEHDWNKIALQYERLFESLARY